jgi:hypothetical protein
MTIPAATKSRLIDGRKTLNIFPSPGACKNVGREPYTSG